jgi:predicted secreted hydrolase
MNSTRWLAALSGARTLIAVAAAALVIVGCSGPILANPTAPAAVPPTPSPAPSTAADPRPITFPPDDAPHDRLTEWWYYTGHLVDASGGRWGFEFVIFRAERAGFPVTWASHLALTNETQGSFTYAQRSEVGPQVNQSPPSGTAFSLSIRGTSPLDPQAATLDPWTMSNAVGPDRLHGALDDGSTIDLHLLSTKPPVLQDTDGWVDFGPAGGSYYYSRTRLDVSGALTIAGHRLAVVGEAWFDHQWGDFISVGGGGWDWFAVNLADGTDLTISRVRAADGSLALAYGTLVGLDGSAQHLGAADVTVEASPGQTWTSLATGAVYPAAWTIRIPRESLVIGLRPTVANQELDTRPTTGVVYWEGSQVVTATRAGTPVAGEAYVELTGYATSAP